MKTLCKALLAVVFIGIISVCVTLIVDKVLARTRLDLTQQRIYTLSQGTLGIVSKTQPVRFTLYYSVEAARKGPDQLRFYNNYYHYVRELLEEYRDRAGGKITLEVVDPRPWSDEEEEAVRLGVKRIPLNNDEAFFFGLVARNELGKKEAIPFFEPTRQEFVEYDITRLVDLLSQREKHSIGIISSLDVMGTPPYMAQMLQMQGKRNEVQAAWTLIEHLKQQYEVKSIEDGVDEIKDVDLLIAVHPKELQEKTLFAIDQFVMHGGKLMAFVDSQCYSDQYKPNPGDQNAFMGAMQYKPASSLNRLTEKWGVTLDDGAIACDRSLGLDASVTEDANRENIIAFLGLNKDCMSKDDPAVAMLNDVKMLFPGVLKINKEAGTKVTPLLSTSSIGAIWRPQMGEMMRLNPARLRSTVKDGTEPLVLAARITGPLKSAFPEGIVLPDAPKDESADADKDAKKDGDKAAGKDKEADATKEPNKKTGLVESTGEPAVIVVADVDMISDFGGLAYQKTFIGSVPVGDNATMVFNMLDTMAGSADLVSVRSRGQYRRPFTVIDAIEKQEEKGTSEQIEAINQKIQDAQTRLNEFAASKSGGNLQLMQAKALDEQDKLREQLRDYNKKLRKLKSSSRERIESMGKWLQIINNFAAPAVVLALAIGLAAWRRMKAARYLSERRD